MATRAEIKRLNALADAEALERAARVVKRAGWEPRFSRALRLLAQSTRASAGAMETNVSLTDRPAPWENPDPDHFHFEAVEAEARWQTTTESKPCRYSVGPNHQSCKAESVARLNRSTTARPRWWHYCADHMFRRWIEDGKVMQWRLVRNAGAEREVAE